ncbi:unnamed protein product, partial [Hapterophycus canaliculatus]
FQAFNYAVNFANTEVIARMLNPSGRRSSLTQSAAARRSSLHITPPVPLALSTAPPAADRGVTHTATSSITSTAKTVDGPCEPSSRGPKSQTLAALRPAPSSLPAPPTAQPNRLRVIVDDADSKSVSSSSGSSNRHRISSGGGRDGEGGSSKIGGVRGSGMVRSEGQRFDRPPPIDTSGLVGALGPASPSPRGKYTGSRTPSPGRERYASGTEDAYDEIEYDNGRARESYVTSDEGEENRERREFLKQMAKEAADVVTMRTLTPTNLLLSPHHAQEESSSATGSFGGDGGGGSRTMSDTDGPSCNGDESKNNPLSLPFRQLIAHHAPSVANHPPARTPLERPLSPRARVGAVRRGSGCDGRRAAFGVGLGGSSGGARGAAGIRWASSRPLTGVRRRGSGSNIDLGTAVGAGVRWASSKPAIDTRPITAPAASGRPYGGRIDTTDGRVPVAIVAGGRVVESESSSMGFAPPRSRQNTALTGSAVSSIAAKAARTPQGREAALSSTRVLARGTARRLSALGAKAIGGIGLAGRNTGRNGSDPSTTSLHPPPPAAASAAAALANGSGSPGAKGGGPPPPPPRGPRRRVS